MSVFTCNFRSACLQQTTTINVILPDDVFEDIPTLYLLHGMYGNYSVWLDRTSIQRYAAKHSIAVVMASAENSFYSNMKFGYNYYDFFANELIDFTRKTFRLSTKREKTYIAGLSMGGYGAVKIAMRNPDTFCAAASLSGCLDIVNTADYAKYDKLVATIWGGDPKNTLKGSADDIFHLIDTFPSDKQMPKIFVACGTEDSLYSQSKSFCEKMTSAGYPVDYHEGSGAHTWDFWDEWIKHAIDFMTK